MLDDLASGRTRFPSVEVRRHEGSHTVSFAGDPPTRPVSPGLTDPARRREWLDARGVDRQLVGGWLDVFGYGIPASEGADWAELLTDALVQQTSGDDRLLPLGTVPLQDPERAAAALRTQRAAGVPGVMIATRADGRDLDDPAYTPFWEVAHETGAIVFLHPTAPTASEARPVRPRRRPRPERHTVIYELREYVAAPAGRCASAASGCRIPDGADGARRVSSWSA